MLLIQDADSHAENIRKYLNSENSSDLKFITKDGILFAHKLVIVSNIPAFKDFLCVRCLESHESITVFLQDWESEVLELALKDLYLKGDGNTLEIVLGLRDPLGEDAENINSEHGNEASKEEHEITNFRIDTKSEVFDIILEGSNDKTSDNKEDVEDETSDVLLESTVISYKGHRLELLERFTRTSNKKVFNLYLDFKNKYRLKRMNNGNYFYFTCTEKKCSSTISLQKVSVSEVDGRASYTCLLFKNCHTHPHKSIEIISRDIAGKHFENFFRQHLHQDIQNEEASKLLLLFNQEFLPSMPTEYRELIKSSFTLPHFRTLLANLKKCLVEPRLKPEHVHTEYCDHA